MAQTLPYRVPVLVVQADGRRPISGAMANVLGPDGGILASAGTGSDGRGSLQWEMTVPDYGAVTQLKIRASAPGYYTTTNPLFLNTRLRSDPEQISLAAVTTKSVSLLVRDATSKQPIAGAKVLLDGGAAQSSDDSGRVSLIFPYGTHALSVNATGYQVYSQAFAVSADLRPIDTVDLTPAPSEPRHLTFIVLPSLQEGDDTAQSSGAQVVFEGESGQVNDSGVWVTSESYADGSYNITVSLEGWTQQGDGIINVVQGSDGYSVTLVQDDTTSDAAAPPADGSNLLSSAARQGQALALAATQEVDSPEFIYPNSEFGKYFTTTQARIYIGNLFIDELDFLQYTLQANRTPVYGYCSRDWDAVGQGRALVQGQLGINFVSEGYLYTVLKNWQKSNAGAKSPEEQDQDEMKSLRTERQLLMSSLGKNKIGASLSDRQQEDRLQMLDDRIDALSSRGPYVFDKISARQLSRVSVSGQSTDINPLYLPIAFDIVAQFERPDGSVVTRKMEQCWLGANDQVLDQSGQPVKDVYSFIARRMR